MFAPLILGILAIYLIIGWVILYALDRRVAEHRTAGSLWLAVIFWPVTVVSDLFHRGGPNHG